jgi:hypothetical protein
LEQLNQKVADKTTERTSAEGERRELEHKIAILQTESQQNERAQVKADRAADEAESLRSRIAEIIDQKAVKANQLIELDKKKVDLEQKLDNAVVQNREYNSKTIADLEKIIEAERKRGQEAIDYVKRTLNAKLRFLELQLEEGRENVTNYSKEKRAQDKKLKSAIRELEDEESKVKRKLLRLETLERKLKHTEEETSKLLIKREFLETQNYSMKRQKDTLTAQLDAALLVSEKNHIDQQQQKPTYQVSTDTDRKTKVDRKDKDIKIDDHKYDYKLDEIQEEDDDDTKGKYDFKDDDIKDHHDDNKEERKYDFKDDELEI